MVGVALAVAFSMLLVVAAIALAQYNPPPPRLFDLALDTSECTEVEPAAEDVVLPEAIPPCQEALAGHLEDLRPGDVLTIAPGTYDIGTVTVREIEGEPDRPIVVTALDPDEPPEIVGALRIHDSDHFTLSHLQFVASQDRLPALAVQCGIGWEVSDSTIRGASDSTAMSNLNISGYQEPPPPPQIPATCPDEPRDFKVIGNCIRDPYTDPELEDHPDPAVKRTRGFYHNIYVSFEGSDATGGIIEGNRIQGSLNGAGIKLGNGATHERGPRNVVVRGNAFVDVRNLVVLSEDVRDNEITGNLGIDVVGPTNAGDDVGVYVSRVREASNVVADNTLWGARWMIRTAPDESAEVIDAGGNEVLPSSEDLDLRTGPDGCVEMSSLPWEG